MQIEAFAAKRREQLTISDEGIRPAVADALGSIGSDGWDDPIVEAASQVWLENYLAEAPDAAYRAARMRFEQRVRDSLAKTSDLGVVSDGQVDRITRWLSTYAVNAGTIQGAYRRGVRFKTWVDMEDDKVRQEHRHAAGQVVPIGGAFTVGGVKVAYPGEPVGPPELYINCRCVAMPAARSGETMSQNTLDLGTNAHTRALIAAGSDGERAGALVVLLPADSDPISAATSEDQAHMTTVWFGDVSELPVDPDELEQAVRLYAQDLDGPIVVPVKGRGLLDDEGADVVFLEPTDSLLAARDGMLANEPILRAYEAAEQYPQWTPHVTLGYPEGVENGPALGEYDGTEVTFDRIGLWLGGDYTDYPMGGTVSAVTADAATDEVMPDPEEEVLDEPEDGEEIITEIPVHGVLAPEGVETGDGRGFRQGALSTRELPIPLRMEIVGSHGGNTSDVVTVGRVDEAWRDEATNMWRYRGAIILSKPHASAAIEGIIDGSGTGVSIDADAMAVDMEGFSEEELAAAQESGKNPTTWFSETRIAGLTIVPIPAFQEAYVGLGPDFEEDMTEEQIAAAAAILEDCGCDDSKKKLATGGIIPRGTMALVGESGSPDYVIPKSVVERLGSFAPGTKDGPGWITHPVATSRIRRYWVRGKGAAKIKWGAPGDFNRCRSQLAKYVQNPDWLAGLCANMHKEALGIWPSQHRDKKLSLIASGAAPAPILRLVEPETEAIVAAGAFPSAYPAEWFANPQFRGVTPLTIDVESRRIYGHLAQWGVCHIGIAGDCVKPPHSKSGYANFLKGVVDTTAGEQAVGCLTYGIGHANPRMRAAAATAHYDRMDAVTAYVNIGEDAYGIWYAGVLAPDVSDELVAKFRAVGAISGDWRPVGRYGLDLIAAVAVNTPGYPVSIAASAGQVTALIAAGMVSQPEESTPETFANDNTEFLADAIALAIEKRENKKREAALRQRALSTRQAEIRRRINKEG